jgi:uncharacterized protein YaaQ
MEPRDREQLSQAEQDERAERLADQLSDQGHRATEGTSSNLYADSNETIARALAALEARIVDLEGQVKDLQRVAVDSPDTAEMEDVDSGEA